MAFFYICLHFLSYLILDLGLNMTELWKDIVKRPYITFGMVSAVMMLFLAITSNNLSIRKLGLRKWKYLHKLTYIIGICAALHYLLLTKTWQIEPIIYFAIVVILIFYRIIKFRSYKVSFLKKQLIYCLIWLKIKLYHSPSCYFYIIILLFLLRVVLIKSVIKQYVV